MPYAINWLVVVAVLTLWSLAAWALQAVAAWSISNAGALSGAASGAAGLSLPGWLTPWVSQEFAQVITQLMVALGSWVDRLLQAAPALVSGLTVTTWVVWGIGSALLVLLGAGLHLLIAMWRQRGGDRGPGTRP